MFHLGAEENQAFPQQLLALLFRMVGMTDCTCEAFSVLDKDGSGVVTTAEMSQTYDVSANPAVQSGKASWLQLPDKGLQNGCTFEGSSETSIVHSCWFLLPMRRVWLLTHDTQSLRHADCASYIRTSCLTSCWIHLRACKSGLLVVKANRIQHLTVKSHSY